MKSFEFRAFNKKMIIMTTAIMLLITFLAMSYFSDYIIDNDIELIVGIAAIIIVLVPIYVINNFIQSKIIVNFSDSELTISKSGRIISSIPFSEISMFRLSKRAFIPSLLIFSVKRSYPISLSAVNKGDNIQEFVEELTSKCNFILTQSGKSYNSGYSEYLNKDLIQENITSIQYIKKNERSLKNKLIWSGIGVFLLSIVILVLPFFINPKIFYNVKDNKIFYGNEEVKGVAANKTAYLSYTVIKDSNHVYYKGKILDWADRSSFECIKDPYYSDKNGIYTETSSLYSKRKIIPLPGDYDKETFQALGYGNHFFKDKNHLYTIASLSVLDDTNLLEKIDIRGLDVGSFQPMQSSYWFADKYRVYFSSFNELRVCPEIDRATFEILSRVVAKDRKNVYYLTRDLKTDDHAATKRDNYAILEDADALSFYMIDERNYADENTTWVIRKEGETINVRSDVK